MFFRKKCTQLSFFTSSVQTSGTGKTATSCTILVHSETALNLTKLTRSTCLSSPDTLCLCSPLCWMWCAHMIRWATASRTTTCSSRTTGSSWWSRLCRSSSWLWSMTEGFPTAPPPRPAWRNRRYDTRTAKKNMCDDCRACVEYHSNKCLYLWSVHRPWKPVCELSVKDSQRGGMSKTLL